MGIETTPVPAGPQRGIFTNICLAIEGRRRAADWLRRASESPATSRPTA